MKKELLNIVDDNDEIIGIEDRKAIHERGLLHREVHVYFITQNGEIIFQHRGKEKMSAPDLLDATVGGHVAAGDTYEETAVKEVREETGVKIAKTDLVDIGKLKQLFTNAKTGSINNAFKKQYVYLYTGLLEDLIVEKGDALGFEMFTIAKLLNLNDLEKSKFIPSIYEYACTVLADFINES